MMDFTTKEGRKQQGVRIQRAIESAGLTVEQVAAHLSCSRALIYQYLSGATLAQSDRLQVIATLTGTKLSSFFTDEEEGKSENQTYRAEARLQENIRHFEELNRAYEAPTDWRGVADTSQRLCFLASQNEDLSTECMHRMRSGKAYIYLGEFNLAIENLLHGIDLAIEIKDNELELQLRQLLGNAMFSTGDTSAARQQFSICMNGSSATSKWLGNLSMAAVEEQMGNYSVASRLCDDAAAILEGIDDKAASDRGLLYVNGNRINIWMGCGDFQNAKVLAKSTISDAESLGIPDQLLEARINLAYCQMKLGELANAVEGCQSAIRLARLIGDEGRLSLAKAMLSKTFGLTGASEKGILLAKDALSSALSRSDRRVELFAQLGLAQNYFNLKRFSEAKYHANHALAVAVSLKSLSLEAEALLQIVHIDCFENKQIALLDYLNRAETIAKDLGANHLSVNAAYLRGLDYINGNDRSNARTQVDAGLIMDMTLSMSPLKWKLVSAGIECGSTLATELVEECVLEIQKERRALINSDYDDNLLELDTNFKLFACYLKQLYDTDAKVAFEFLEATSWPPLNQLLDMRS